MGGFTKSITLDSAEATSSLAKRIGRQLGAGDVLLLYGEVGTGKSHFARTLIQDRLSAADLYEDVPSPTYTLVQAYWDGTLEIWHADLYRLSGQSEIHELGLGAAFEEAVCLVEWPDRLGNMRPKNALSLNFSYGVAPDSRQICIAAKTSGWEKIQTALLEYDDV